MAKALPAGRPIRRRALFGALRRRRLGAGRRRRRSSGSSSSSWPSATSRTGPTTSSSRGRSTSGILGWSPVNLCPPENGTAMPCPVPAGAVLPWQAVAGGSWPCRRRAPTAPRPSSARTCCTSAGSDGTAAPSATTYVADDRERQRSAPGRRARRCRRRAPTRRRDPQRHGLPRRRPRARTASPPTRSGRIGLDPDTSELGDMGPRRSQRT